MIRGSITLSYLALWEQSEIISNIPEKGPLPLDILFVCTYNRPMENDLNRRLDAAFRGKLISRQSLLRKLLKQASPREPDIRGANPRKDRGFTPEQFVIIGILHSYGHGVTVSEITEAIDVPHSNVTRTLDRLEKKGLIHRKRGEDDKRQMIVRLTLEGTKAAKSLSQVQRILDKTLWGRLSESEKLVLLELLGR